VERNLLQELKVGIFVVVFVFLIGLTAFILGGSSDIFEPTYTIHTWYRDVKGLKPGALVRVAGVDVGEVSKVEFENAPPPPDISSEDAKRRSIYVELKVQQQYQERIREDSIATISSVGLLGDMYITVSTGDTFDVITMDGKQLYGRALDPKADPVVVRLEDGSEHTVPRSQLSRGPKPSLIDSAVIKSAEALDILDYANKGTEIVENARNISHKVDMMLGSDASAESAQISGSLAHIEEMLEEAKNGKGLLHTLIYDASTAATLKRSLANLEQVAGDVAAITGEVRHGNGIANTLIYGEGGDELVAEITSLAKTLEGVIADLKNEESLAHAILYDPEKAQLMEDLQGTVASLRAIAGAIDEGEGTIGLLVRDPQVYEDLRSLLGGARRNALLRAYVRATVERGQDQGSGWNVPSDDPEKGGR
jgi:phospholipid/cholesterol/gamma-HCH transport system substrate-binding protein